MKNITPEIKSQQTLIIDAYKKLYAVGGPVIPIIKYDPYIIPVAVLLYDVLTLKSVMNHESYRTIEDMFIIKTSSSRTTYNTETKELKISIIKKNCDENYVHNLCLTNDFHNVESVELVNTDEKFYDICIKIKKDTLIDHVLTRIKNTGNPNINISSLKERFKNEILSASDLYKRMISRIDTNTEVSLKDQPHYVIDAIKRFINKYKYSFMLITDNNSLLFHAETRLNIIRELYFTPYQTQLMVLNRAGNIETNQTLVNIFKFFIDDLDSDVKFNKYDLFSGKYLKKEC